MITFFDDGVYCKACDKFHPTISWHEKYGYSQTVEGKREQYRELVETRPGLVGLPTDGSASEERKTEVVEWMLEHNMRYPQVNESDESVCAVCGARTTFVSRKTGRHVCSDECLYRENGWGEDFTGHAVDGMDPESMTWYEKICRERNWPTHDKE